MGETKKLKKNILSKNNSQTRICLGDTTKSKEYSGTGGKWCFRAQIRMRNPRVCVRPAFSKKGKNSKKQQQETRNNKQETTKMVKQRNTKKMVCKTNKATSRITSKKTFAAFWEKKK